MAARPTTFQFDEKTLDKIDKLSSVYGTTNTAATIHRALALASLVADEATADRTITITGKGEPVEVSLAT